MQAFEVLDSKVMGFVIMNVVWDRLYKGRPIITTKTQSATLPLVQSEVRALLVTCRSTHEMNVITSFYFQMHCD